MTRSHTNHAPDPERSKETGASLTHCRASVVMLGHIAAIKQRHACKRKSSNSP